MESRAQPSGVSIYSQDPVLSARHSPGLARVSAAFVTQVDSLRYKNISSKCLALSLFSLVNISLLPMVLILSHLRLYFGTSNDVSIMDSLTRYLKRCKFLSPMRRLLLV